MGDAGRRSICWSQDFTGAQVERVQIAPRDVGAAKIGHFGFFRPDHRDTLWRDAADWLARVKSFREIYSAACAP